MRSLPMIRKAVRLATSHGVTGLVRAMMARLRSLFAEPAKSYLQHRDFFTDKKGIEFGGPSPAFGPRGIFPVYPIVGTLDNCNFRAATVWEDEVNEGATFIFNAKKPPGYQHIAEATALVDVASEEYDFVLSSHMLEHAANPIRALLEWKRLLLPGGMLVLLLPDRRYTFDHQRPVTTMHHLIADFETDMQETDLTHLPEILALHDLDRDPEAGSMQAFTSRSLHNFDNRCLHHHVFDSELAVALVEYAGFGVCAVEEIQPHHVLVLARKHATRLLPGD